MVNKNESGDDKGILTTEDGAKAAFDKYESYADICDGEVAEIYLGDEVHYGVLAFDRWKNVPVEISGNSELHHYDIRHDDEGEPITIKSHILVNYFGTFITYDELPITEDEEKDIEIGYIN